jgi:Amt family ammonium transporter
VHVLVAVLKHRLGIDDALDVGSVHGVSGVVGSLAIGLLADPAADPALARAGLPSHQY